MTIVRVSAELSQQVVPGLAHLLVDSVDDGASVGFLAPLAHADAAGWWQESLQANAVRTWVARDGDGTIDGCVQLALVTYPNGRHRADVRKLLVHRRARRRGLATRLLAEVENDARAHGRTLLMLDTQSGSPAESLYLREGWTVYGHLPDHARTPDGRLEPTTFMAKTLSPRATG